jgi:F0F1-type ATP synthase membrane subunit b/b'
MGYEPFGEVAMTPTALDTSTSIGSGHPLIDIDLTVLVQFGLFLILFVAANALLFQPYLKLRERRRAGIEGAREEASNMSATADAKLAEFEKSLGAARSRANEEGRKVRAEAAAYERETTDKAKATATAAMTEAQTKVRTETEAARAQLMPQADALARAMAGKLLGREVA